MKKLPSIVIGLCLVVEIFYFIGCASMPPIDLKIKTGAKGAASSTIQLGKDPLGNPLTGR